MPVPNFSSHMTNLMQMPVDKAARLMLGVDDYTILHAANGNVEAPENFRNCRAIKVDVEGIVRVRYVDDFMGVHTEVLYVPAGIFIQYRNVVALYRYYTGTTLGTASCYADDGGTLVNALKLYR